MWFLLKVKFAFKMHEEQKTLKDKGILSQVSINDLNFNRWSYSRRHSHTKTTHTDIDQEVFCHSSAD